MSNYAQVTVNEKTAGEVEPEDKPQEESNDTEKPEGSTQEQQQAGEEAPATEDQDPERPEWLDERFKTAEDLQKSYNELEKKLKERQDKPDTEDQSEGDKPTEARDGSGFMELVTEASEEFYGNEGKLSDETYSKLEAAGLPRELVDSYAQGQMAIKSQFDQSIQSVANGEFPQMAEWMGKSLGDAELDSYNQAVNSGNEGIAKLAVEGMYSRYKAANGTQPRLVQGETSGTGGVIPFQSAQELTRAMQDERYKKGDPAYHKEIDRRLAVTTAF